MSCDCLNEVARSGQEIRGSPGSANFTGLEKLISIGILAHFLEFEYSSVPNKRVGLNKRVGWNKNRKLINV